MFVVTGRQDKKLCQDHRKENRKLERKTAMPVYWHSWQETALAEQTYCPLIDIQNENRQNNCVR